MTEERYNEIMDYSNFMIDCANPYDMEIKKALEKQIPKKTYRGYIPRGKAANCGICNSFIGFSDQTNRHNYCPKCGQAIKWE